MIAVLIALYGAGMMMMVMLIRAAKPGLEYTRRKTCLFTIFFWPFVIVTCYIMAAIEIISEEWKGK